MIVFYLIAAHLVGDFVFQTRWQAAGKYGDSVEAFSLRARHVTSYCLPFIPIAIVYSQSALWATAFVVWLWVLHFFTDRQRFTSTFGDLVGWRLGGREAWLGGPPDPRAGAWPPSNPWSSAPMMIDQTLHVCQIALLAGLLL